MTQNRHMIPNQSDVESELNDLTTSDIEQIQRILSGKIRDAVKSRGRVVKLVDSRMWDRQYDCLVAQLLAERGYSEIHVGVVAGVGSFQYRSDDTWTCTFRLAP